jgi:hypothetical protein
LHGSVWSNPFLEWGAYCIAQSTRRREDRAVLYRREACGREHRRVAETARKGTSRAYPVVRSVVGRIEQKVEEIVDEGCEVLEHLRGHWSDEDDESDPGTPRNVVALRFAPGELQRLQLKVALDKEEPLGAVHVFDVVQLNQDGTRGGFRLATINTPAE